MSWILVDEKTGKRVSIGDELVSFRGERAVVNSFHPPRHAASSGHVDTTDGYYYPSVYGCKYVNSLPDELAKEARAIEKGVERKKHGFRSAHNAIKR